ncbi:hypothetical protein EVAR_9586_1 [Eumeta japonica]|uniref:Uncharacterized protein n=1 Tax=Eumeta variegata TaxID=151549 RepID=A0A4C1TKP4_EUMVA|nr:hypothetical protein EVAR_9586_1 [Eumeta japonica]
MNHELEALKIPRGRPKKPWKDCIEEALRNMGKKTSWRREAKNRAKWKKTVEEAKTPQRVVVPREAEDNNEFRMEMWSIFNMV